MHVTACMLPNTSASAMHVETGHFGRVYTGVQKCSLAPWLQQPKFQHIPKEAVQPNGRVKI